MATQLPDIAATDWSPALGAPGTVVEGLDDIDQCVRIILSTPQGSDPHRPLFGSNIHDYIDYPQNRITPHLVRESVDAVKLWEPRIVDVAVSVAFAGAQAILTLDWTGTDGTTGTTAVLL